MTQLILNCVISYLIQLSLSTASMLAGRNDAVQDRLYDKLLANYSRSLIPMCKDSPLPVEVSLSTGVRQLIKLDETHELLNIKVFLRIYWHDCRLRWNPNNWKGLRQISVPAHEIWTPDIMLYDGIQPLMRIDSLEHYIRVESTGYSRMSYPGLIRTPCKLDVKKFPFDRQLCNLTFGSWSYGDREIKIIKTESTTDFFKENKQWTITNIDSPLRIYTFDTGSYTTQRYVIHLQRKPFFYTMNILIPSALFTVITLLGFFLPAGCGEKMTLQITTLLSLSVFNTVIISSLPATSDVPYIAINFILGMVIVTVACAMTVVVLDIHFSNHARPLPPYMRHMMAGKFGKMICCFKRRARNWIRRDTWLSRKLTLRKNQKNKTKGNNDHSQMPEAKQHETGFGSDLSDSSNSDFDDTSISESRMNWETGMEDESARPKRRVFINDDKNFSHNLNTPEAKYISHDEYHTHTPKRSGGQKNFNLEWQLFAIFLDRLFMYIIAFLLIGVNLIVYLHIIDWDMLN